MALKIFKNKDKRQVEAISPPSNNDNLTQWIKCNSCGALMYHKEVLAQNNVCPKCNYHFRLSLQDRIRLLFDSEIIEYDRDLKPTDPLNFIDKKSYRQRIHDASAKNGGRESSALACSGEINGVPVQAVIFDFDFMGGSLASVEGEKIVRAIRRSLERKEGLLICSTSGGARMQESTYALMQMAKTSAALNELAAAKIPYISLLCDPTMGGVSASFAFLGDIIIAEPGASIGFAGARVIKQTIGQDLPEGFQTSEFLLKHGLIDMIVPRKEIKKTISSLMLILNEHNNRVKL